MAASVTSKKILDSVGKGYKDAKYVKIIKDQIFLSNQDNILYSIDSQTGKKVSFGSKKTLIESFKTEKIDQNLDVSLKNNNRFNNNNILKFY